MGRNERLINRYASTAMAMVAYGSQGYTPAIQHENTIRKGEAKKCKSCKQYGVTCKVPPMQIACEKHERRKKK